MTALIALLDVTAKRGGSTEFDRGHDASLRRAQRRVMSGAIGVAVAATRPPLPGQQTGPSGAGSEILTGDGRQGDGRRTRQQLQGAFRGADLARGDPQIPGRGCQAAVAKQKLDGANVGPGFKQVDREGMP